MKLKSTYITHDMKDEQVLVDVSGSFSGVVRSNPTAAFIVNCLKQETTLDEIAAKMTDEYEVDESRAREDASAIIEKLRSVGAIEEYNKYFR